MPPNGTTKNEPHVIQSSDLRRFAGALFQACGVAGADGG